MKKWQLHVIQAVGLIAFVAFWAYGLENFGAGSATPNTLTGQTIPIDNHGTVRYVRASENNLFLAGGAVSWLVVMVSTLILIRRRSKERRTGAR